jgi:hypothetical protein
MRIPPLLMLFLTAILSSPAWAQRPGVQLEAGLGYARLFDGGGISFAAALERPLSDRSRRLQHALGGSVWYAHTDLASNPDDPDGRHTVGVGFRYQLGIGRSSTGLFLAVPVQLLHSSIPDRTDVVSANLATHGIPDVPGERPAEDRIGSAWGWGAGLELGLRLGLGEQLSAQSSVQGLYQDIYDASRQHGAWSWHAGLTYHFLSQ